MSASNNIEKDELISKLHAETAKISWTELMPHYARDVVLLIDDKLDLIEVAITLINDDAEKIQSLMTSNELIKVDAVKAKEWANKSETELTLWAVVVSPWVVVQESSR